MIRAQTHDALKRLARLDKSVLNQKQLGLAQLQAVQEQLHERLGDLDRRAEEDIAAACGNVPALYALAESTEAQRKLLHIEIANTQRLIEATQHIILELRGRIKLIDKLAGQPAS